AIAGVIGGEETAVTGATVDVLLEAANFSGPSVRQTSRALGLRTEASARFERALPPELALAGARRAASLISELAGASVHREWTDGWIRCVRSWLDPATPRPGIRPWSPVAISRRCGSRPMRCGFPILSAMTWTRSAPRSCHR